MTKSRLTACSMLAVLTAGALCGVGPALSAHAATSSFTTFATTTVGTKPYGIAIDSVARKVFVTNEGSNTVSVLDETTGAVVGLPLAVGKGPQGIAVDSLRHRAFVANAVDGTVTVIDTASAAVLGTTPVVGVLPSGIDIDDVTGVAYVVTVGGLASVDGTTIREAAAPIPMSGSPFSVVAIDSTRREAWVTSYDRGSVATVNLDDRGVFVLPVRFGAGNRALAINTVTKRVYTCNSTVSQFVILDELTRTVLAPEVGVDCTNLAVDEGTNQVFIASGGLIVQSLDGASSTLTPTRIMTGAGSFDAAVDPLTSDVFIANKAAGSVTAVHQTVSPTFTSTALPKATVGVPYEFRLTATGAPRPTFSLGSGALPDGLKLDSATGLISGTPTSVGAPTCAVAATNLVLPDVTTDCTVTVEAAPVIPTTTPTPSPTSTPTPEPTTTGGSAGGGGNNGRDRTGSGQNGGVLASTGNDLGVGSSLGLAAGASLVFIVAGVLLVGRRRTRRS